jgi:hypothetical protein
MSTCQPFGVVIGERRLGEDGIRSRIAQGTLPPPGPHHPPRQPESWTSHGEILQAELAGEISEFQSLNLQAILTMAEDSELTGDYLEMAEAIASSPHERAIVKEIRTTYDLLHSEPLTAARRCLIALEPSCQTEGLWRSLLIALGCVGDAETIDAVLSGLARLHDEAITRLVEFLSSQPRFRDLWTRAMLVRDRQLRPPAVAKRSA